MKYKCVFQAAVIVVSVLAVSIHSCGKKKEEEDKAVANLVVRHETQKLASYNFGALTFADVRSVMLTVENTGQLDATVSSLEVKDSSGGAITAYNYTGGTFPGTGGTCKSTIPGNTDCSISVSYTAPAGSAYSSATHSGTATLTYNNGAASSTVAFDVSGTSRKCANGSGLSIDQMAYEPSNSFALNAPNQYIAQSFTFPDNRIVKKIKLSQYKGVGATFSRVRIAFYASASSLPTGSSLATQDFSDPGLVQSSRASYTYTLTTPFDAAASTTYWIVISYPDLTGGHVHTDRPASDATSFGFFAYSNDGTSWMDYTGQDLTHSMETCLADVAVAESATYTAE